MTSARRTRTSAVAITAAILLAASLIVWVFQVYDRGFKRTARLHADISELIDIVFKGNKQVNSYTVRSPDQSLIVNDAATHRHLLHTSHGISVTGDQMSAAGDEGPIRTFGSLSIRNPQMVDIGNHSASGWFTAGLSTGIANDAMAASSNTIDGTPTHYEFRITLEFSDGDRLSEADPLGSSVLKRSVAADDLELTSPIDVMAALSFQIHCDFDRDETAVYLEFPGRVYGPTARDYGQDVEVYVQGRLEVRARRSDNDSLSVEQGRWETLATLILTEAATMTCCD